jgi:hypothetical protein
MIAAEVEFYNVVVWAHITAVMLVWGPTFAYGVFFATAGKTNPAALPTIGRVVVTWSSIAGRLGILTVLVSGLYLVDDGGIDFGSFFVSWGLAATVTLYALLEAYFIPTTKRFVAAAEAGRQEDVMAIASHQKVVGPLAGILVILTIYVMTAKPFA